MATHIFFISPDQSDQFDQCTIRFNGTLIWLMELMATHIFFISPDQFDQFDQCTILFNGTLI
jgi:hypothetical protein